MKPLHHTSMEYKTFGLCPKVKHGKCDLKMSNFPKYDSENCHICSKIASPRYHSNGRSETKINYRFLVCGLVIPFGENLSKIGEIACPPPFYKCLVRPWNLC